MGTRTPIIRPRPPKLAATWDKKQPFMQKWPRPFYSIGILVDARDEGSLAFLGSCFAYESRQHFVTASHCVGTLKPHQVRIVLPLVEQEDLGRVQSITHHPQADLAVLQASSSGAPEIAPFVGVSTRGGWGQPIQALGYPEETEANGTTLPTARLFTGFIQRLMIHASQMEYRYNAGELSFGSPAGLSGGPVFPTSENDRVLGVVTENHDSTTYLRSVAEVQDGDNRYTEKVHEVIRYGIFANLLPIEDWLAAQCRV